MTINKQFNSSTGMAITDESIVSALLVGGGVYTPDEYVVTVVNRANHFAEVYTLLLTKDGFELPSERIKRAMGTAWINSGFPDYPMDKALA